MKPAVVADIGNTRIKWGRCRAGRVEESCALPPDDPVAWQQQCRQWQVPQGASWVVTAVHPERCSRLVGWLQENGYRAHLLDRCEDLPLRVLLERPDHVGMDRLLDAVAVNARRTPEVPAVVVDAGSAITVDWIDASGAFAGGVIVPGMRLMALALHEHTALLPLIEPPRLPPELPGLSTPAAMVVGVYWATVGAVDALVRQYQLLSTTRPMVFFTGGDGPLLHAQLGQGELCPLLTLEGILLAAEALP
jgi:type III pantothenate kinase